ncbi:MAG: glycoside hydrolase family 3 C-terminal domain-containing protein [Bacteroidales bacterium]|nr:glycoside hydrolase family 3 C-terminal domain-containing protein [Bacteroidales bacterium]
MKKALLAIGAALGTFSLFAQPQLGPDNIEQVLSAMTLEEKAHLLVGCDWGCMPPGAVTAFTTFRVPGAAGSTRAIPRLGIPSAILADGPAGLRINPRRDGSESTYFCTGFPVGTVMASSWDPSLVTELTAAMGEEVREYGVDVLLAPGMNLHRNPLCGRNFEYFSEDPLLAGLIGAAYVRGVQSNGVGVSVKHFAANNQEINRLENESRVNVRALRELYLKGFEIAVRQSDPWTMMSSYNKLNGHYAQQSHDLLTGILRDEWGFRGIVMTDWGFKDGTVKAVQAGNDLMEPGADYEVQRILDAVQDGTLSVEDIDRNARHILEFLVKTPAFKGYRYSDKPDLEGHAALVRKAAPEGMVLLENRGVLPLRGVSKVALYGVGSYDFIAGGTGSGNVNKAYIRSVKEGLEAHGMKVDAELAEWYRQYISYKKTEMKNAALGEDKILLGEAVVPEMPIGRKYLEKNAIENEIAIMTISRNAGEGNDRKAVEGDWSLTVTERALMQDIADVCHAIGRKFIVVLNIGGVIETASWKHIPDAILLAWTPGQEGGNAVADVLCGAAYPSGKLPMTFPVDYFSIPSSHNFPYRYFGNAYPGPAAADIRDVGYTEYQEGIWVGYRYFGTAGVPVSYPFGYGLSYTAFEYSKPVVKVAKDGTLTASITVRNCGTAPGKEIVQLYVSAPEGGLVKPAQELKAFAKTSELAPGRSETLTMSVDPYTLASFNPDSSAWETAAGSYEARFGASSADIRAKASFRMARPFSWPVKPLLLPAVPVEEIAVQR